MIPQEVWQKTQSQIKGASILLGKKSGELDFSGEIRCYMPQRLGRWKLTIGTLCPRPHLSQVLAKICV